jgi:hypothetical protein
MTRDDIIRMAREAGFPIPKVPNEELEFALVSVIERYAALVAAAEREECAKVCDIVADQAAQEQSFWAISAAEECAELIRARSE